MFLKNNSIITRFWNYISLLGLEDLGREEAFMRYRDILLLNRLVTILEILLIFYLPVEIIFHGFNLVPIILVQMAIVSLTLVFNARKKFAFARWYFFATAIFATAPILLITPREAGNNLLIVPCALIPVIMFREFWKIFGGFLVVVFIFYAVEFTRDDVKDIIEIPTETLDLFSHIFAGMLFIILFMLMLYFKNINRDYETVITEKTNELKMTKEIIEQRSKDITDSINYAQRIQSAILPPHHFIDKYLSDYFILYKPKDIVAGDFYWAEHFKDYFFIAAADCTGHGVPGAMVSVVCSNALNRALKEFELTEPGKILDKTTDLVLQTFEKSVNEVKDGMDISLMAINLKTNEIKWSGANNSFLMIENGNLTEIKANKQPIGHSDHRVPFMTHEIHPQKGALIYLLTDGFADQFGGEKGKKFKHANLLKLLLENSNLELAKINHELSIAFDNWKLDLEQVDDVCIIGIRI